MVVTAAGFTRQIKLRKEKQDYRTKIELETNFFVDGSTQHIYVLSMHILFRSLIKESLTP